MLSSNELPLPLPLLISPISFLLEAMMNLTMVFLKRSVKILILPGMESVSKMNVSHSTRSISISNQQPVVFHQDFLMTILFLPQEFFLFSSNFSF